MADSLDEPQILNLCALMHEENRPQHPLSWAKVVPMIRLATQHERGMIGVIGDRGDLKAAILLVIEPIWYSDDWHLLEYFNFVRPDARKSTYAKDLINYAKSISDALHINLTIGVFSSERTEAKVRLYRRLLPCTGAFFSYRPESISIHRQEAGAMILANAPPANSIAAE